MIRIVTYAVSNSAANPCLLPYSDMDNINAPCQCSTCTNSASKANGVSWSTRARAVVAWMSDADSDHPIVQSNPAARQIFDDLMASFDEEIASRDKLHGKGKVRQRLGTPTSVVQNSGSEFRIRLKAAMDIVATQAKAGKSLSKQLKSPMCAPCRNRFSRKAVKAFLSLPEQTREAYTRLVCFSHGATVTDDGLLLVPMGVVIIQCRMK